MTESSEAKTPPLTFEEARVLGCLIEKETTTPDYYPMTLNAIVTACNQTSSRDPVVSFDERTVIQALEGLKARQLVFQVTLAGARTQKYKHNLPACFPHLDKPGMALLCTLILRGPQTVGELRQRTERMQSFPGLAAVEAELTKLIEYPGGPLVAGLPPGGGRKVASFAHLLCGEVAAPGPVIGSAAPIEGVDAGWREKIEAEIATLRAELEELKARFASPD